MSYQKTIIVGNVGRDPELRYTPDGTAVCDLSIASTRKWKNSTGQLNEETAWTRWTCWDGMATTAAQYLMKGRQVMVEGRLKPDPETGGPRVFQKNDGTWGASYEFVCERLTLLGNRGDSSTTVAGVPAIENDGLDFA
jgi:single-strand DNA-binding protein